MHKFRIFKDSVEPGWRGSCKAKPLISSVMEDLYLWNETVSLIEIYTIACGFMESINPLWHYRSRPLI